MDNLANLHIVSVLNQTKDITNNYISKLPDINRGKFWQIVYADAKGFVGGAVSGAALATLATGVGAGVGAIIGGTVIGSLASAAEAEKLNKGSGDSNNAIFNNNNQYDNIGISHYNIFKNYYNLEHNNIEPYDVDLVLFYNESLNYFSDNEYDADTIEFFFPYNTYIDTWEDYYDNEYITDINTVIVDLFELGDITYDSKEILLDYIDAMELSDSYTSFASYSISIENIITDSNYAEMQKIYLLGFMSTSRIGAYYWNVFGN